MTYATRQDVQERHPREIAVLAADEITRQVDWARVDASLVDVSAEIRGILAARYSPSELGRLDPDSLALLKLFAVDMALYRVALSFSRQTPATKERYDLAVARLQGIAKGTGGLGIEPGPAGPGDGGDGTGEASPNEVILEAPERMFTRDRLGRI